MTRRSTGGDGLLQMSSLLNKERQTELEILVLNELELLTDRAWYALTWSESRGASLDDVKTVVQDAVELCRGRGHRKPSWSEGVDQDKYFARSLLGILIGSVGLHLFCILVDVACSPDLSPSFARIDIASFR